MDNSVSGEVGLTVDLHSIFPILGSLLATLGLGSGAAASRWIGEGNRALVKRFGKAVRVKSGPNRGQFRVLKPGFNWIFPGIDKIAQTHVRQNVMNLGDEEITLKDKTVFTVDGVLIYTVNDTPDDLYRALFEVSGLTNAVKLYCIGVLREVVRELTYEELIGGNPQGIREQLTERVRERFASWGLRVESFSLGDLSPYGDTLRMIQTPAAARLKLEALKEIAGELGKLTIDPQLAAVIAGIPVSMAVNGAKDPQ
jgi:regulator of protease activity HflC (stomatin/prohibitin superfamily)